MEQTKCNSSKLAPIDFFFLKLSLARNPKETLWY